MIAVGIPTVVDAATIVMDAMERVLEQEKIPESYRIADGLDRIGSELNNMYMTGKDVDSVIKRVSYLLSEGINMAMELRMQRKGQSGEATD